MRPTPLAAALGLALTLAGCTQMAALTDRPSAPQATEAQVSAATAVTRAPSPRPVARATPAQLDTTTPEQRAAAAQAPASAETRLGTTVGSLGNPSEGGFWIKTPLVQERAQGRIVNPATGKSAQVELIPLTGGGSGSQVSLPALQLLGVSLTDLPTLEVYRS
ncbi:hypothetical protein E4191_06830 [Paracoccus liaowanqingii]|uniref:D-galactarate dehydratase n=2 Tax=Paracoccus liaowanqingii TaxID=2560053 RepID=A0A4P7HMB8_9RHOB|nr:hypothetical protein [Paracoccus liaowanqingii]QBX34457.1 hypothetical protein E4191_06830 [Paracoccus liaowanqingii]